MGVTHYPARWEVPYLGKQEASLFLPRIQRYWELSCVYQHNSVSSDRHWAIAVPAWTCVAIVFGYWFYEGCVHAALCLRTSHPLRELRTLRRCSLNMLGTPPLDSLTLQGAWTLSFASKVLAETSSVSAALRRPA